MQKNVVASNNSDQPRFNDNDEPDCEEEGEDIELYEVNLMPEEGESEISDTNQDDGLEQATEGINTDEFEHIAEIYD